MNSIESSEFFLRLKNFHQLELETLVKNYEVAVRNRKPDDLAFWQMIKPFESHLLLNLYVNFQKQYPKILRAEIDKMWVPYVKKHQHLVDQAKRIDKKNIAALKRKGFEVSFDICSWLEFIKR